MNFLVEACTFRLKFRFPFRIQHGSRDGTDAVFVKITSGSAIGFGEAALPPYLNEGIDQVLGDLASLVQSGLLVIWFQQGAFAEALRITGRRIAAIAAIDMAMWEIRLQKEETALTDSLAAIDQHRTMRSYTLGMGDKMDMAKKIKHAEQFHFDFFKIKLDGKSDIKIIQDYLELSSLPFAVDVNEGWDTFSEHIEFAEFLQSKGCLLIEQPFPRNDRMHTKWLADSLSIPVIADEACWLPSDLPGLLDSFRGINIKLRKCGGITRAIELIKLAHHTDMICLIGCMSESSVACSSASKLAPYCQWSDLDGPWLIDNDPDPQSLPFIPVALALKA